MAENTTPQNDPNDPGSGNTTVPGGRYIEGGFLRDAHGNVLGDVPESAPASQKQLGEAEIPPSAAAAGLLANNLSAVPGSTPTPSASQVAQRADGGQVDPATMNLDDLRDYVATVNDPAEIDRLRTAEAVGKKRSGATDLFDARAAEIQAASAPTGDAEG